MAEKPSVLILLADGCEELEAVTVIDLLRRAEINIVSASLNQSKTISCSRRTQLIADKPLDEVLADDFAMLVLPGGQPGTNNLNADPRVHQLLKSFSQQKRYIAAICAAPLVLANAGLLNGKKVTAFPNVLDQKLWPEIKQIDEAVVMDGDVLTSRGPGTAIDFALKIIATLVNDDKRNEVEASLVR